MGLSLSGTTDKRLADIDAGLGPASAAPLPLTGVRSQQETQDRCFPMGYSRYLPSKGLLCGRLALLLLALI